jgi:aminoacyl-tRNA hydrolase
MPLTFQFLKDARASRKILVIGTISDYLGASGPKYVAVARQALEVADHVVFVGPRASTCLKAKRHPADDALHAAPRLDAARRHLERILRPGDLVLVKGSSADHLGPLIDIPVGAAAQPTETAQERDRAPGEMDTSVKVIVGLGNPGESYQDTPHSVGQRALELVAGSLGATLTTEADAMVARVDHASGTCYLVKPLTMMNTTGTVLQRLGETLGFGAENCILLQDDADLPLGKVRTRMTGGDGGHRGVRSVLEAFQSQAACRVKIGVGRPARGTEMARHVLAAFEPTELLTVDRACAEAASRAIERAGIAQQRRAGAVDSVEATGDRRSP